MGQRLDALPTPATFLDVAHAVEHAWQRLLGSTPTSQSLSVLLAQSALETGHWKHSYCYNLGNAKATDSWQGDYCFYFADEIVPMQHASVALQAKAPRTDGQAGHNVVVQPLSNDRAKVTLYPDHPWCRFRAFSTLEDGAFDYLELLHRRFHKAWPAVESGDPEAFVRALKEQRYFTTSVERYLPPVASLFRKFSAALAAKQHVVPPPPPPVPAGNRPTLRVLPSDEHVKELQERLLALGYTDTGMQADGVFNAATQQAVEVFQLQHLDSEGKPLDADGVVGKKTWWALLNPSGDAQKSNLEPSSTTGLTPARTKLLELLFQEHAKPVAEKPDGSNRSPDIDRYWGNTGLIGLPWCCAFVSFALHSTLGRYPIHKHHVGVQAMWVDARTMGLGTETPKPGDLFVQIKSGGRGHTGFVVGVSNNGDTIYTCEGNCGNRVKLGQRKLSTIHHFIDCLADGQSLDFPRGTNRDFEDLDPLGTR